MNSGRWEGNKRRGTEALQGGMGPWAFGVPLILVSAVGLVLNAYVLIVVGLSKPTQQQQTTNTLLLIHLGAVEAAVCFVVLVFATGGWPSAGTSCALHGFLLALLHPVALWTVTGLNCDRYYAIAEPLRYSALVSPRRVVLGLVASWTGALVLCVPPFSGLVPPYRYNPGLGCCLPDFGSASWYGALYAALGLVLPALLVTACNLRVLGIARYHRHRIASAIYEVTLSAQVTITHQRNPFSFVPTVTSPAAGGPPRFHSAASTVMQLVGSLYLLYFPYCGLIIWESCGVGSHHRLSSHPRLAGAASLLLACSPPLNGLLYGLKSRTLRRSVKNYWRKKATKSELQQEIQARTPSVAGSRRPSGSGPTSLFPFPPLQRRLSEALLVLGSCRSGTFESGSIGNAFQRTRLQPAASCNTLRVPAPESGETGKPVRSSASAANLIGAAAAAGARGFEASGCSPNHGETPRKSPRILITRTYSEESQEGGSPLLKRSSFAAPCEKRRWRQRSTGSGSSTGSNESCVWTTGVAPRLARNGAGNSEDFWTIGRTRTRGNTLEEGLFSARPTNNSDSSDTTDTTATTASNLPSKTLFGEEHREEEESKRTPGESDSEDSWGSVESEDGREAVEKHEETRNRKNCHEEDDRRNRRERRKERSRGKSNPEEYERRSQLRPLLTSSS
ncbi:beta-3 adrenergic receptor [Orussus abietinus]|uniref:beta-3 adrenergic receptor n=1 Tax=Orussus abietinus TaxID=222816 RepID=UPI000626C058|nr:beta-3 adrenergic receptor [Orussus abietinus]